MKIKAIVITDAKGKSVAATQASEGFFSRGNTFISALDKAIASNLNGLQVEGYFKIERDDVFVYIKRQGNNIFAFSADAEVDRWKTILDSIAEKGPKSTAGLDEIIASPEKYMQSKSATKLISTQAVVADIKHTTINNIDKLIERGEKIEDLKAKSADLKESALTFKNSARQLNVKMFWKDCCGGVCQCCAACGCVPCCCDKMRKTPKAPNINDKPSTPLIVRAAPGTPSINAGYNTDSSTVTSESSEVTPPRCCGC